MQSDIDFSIIIPQRNSLQTLPRLFASIPEADNIEIILVDNSQEPVTKEQIAIDRDYTLCWCPPERFAGGARNVGMEHAKGKWLIFSDADDYFTENAFKFFKQQKESDADVIYFCAEGIYPDTGEKSSQADLYTRLVRSYLNDQQEEIHLRMSFHVPWAKMVKRSFVEEKNIRYDEVVANNDDYFSLLSGYYANKVSAVNNAVYYYAVSHGSIMRRRSKEVMRTRLEVILRCNQFKKQHNLGHYQGSVAYFLAEGVKFGPKTFLQFLWLVLRYRQNPFIGCTNWLKTARKMNRLDKKNKNYLTKE